MVASRRVPCRQQTFGTAKRSVGFAHVNLSALHARNRHGVLIRAWKCCSCRRPRAAAELELQLNAVYAVIDPGLVERRHWAFGAFGPAELTRENPLVVHTAQATHEQQSHATVRTRLCNQIRSAEPGCAQDAAWSPRYAKDALHLAGPKR